MRALPLPYFFGYFAAIGAAAGLGAWLLIFVLGLLSDLEEPSGLALALAIPRGALFGVILALILRAVWKRRAG